MIVQPGTVYDDHYVWLLKNGIDQTDGEIVLSGATWSYYEDNFGGCLTTTATTVSTIEYPLSCFVKRYMYIELRSATSQSNYAITLQKNGSNWDYQSWYYSNGSQLSSNSAADFTKLYGKRGTIRMGTNLSTATITGRIGIKKSNGYLYVYSIYCSDYTNDFISKSPTIT